MGDNSISLSSKLYGHPCIWNSSLNCKLLGNTDCLHWIWVALKNMTPFPFIFLYLFSLSFYILLLLIKVCYYCILVLTKYHWNISFKKKLPSKYAVKMLCDKLFFQWISRVCQIKKNKYETIVQLLYSSGNHLCLVMIYKNKIVTLKNLILKYIGKKNINIYWKESVMLK